MTISLTGNQVVSESNSRVATVISYLVLIVAAIMLMVSVDLADESIRYAGAAACLVIGLVLLWYVSKRVILTDVQVVEKRLMPFPLIKRIQYKDVKELHLHYKGTRFSDVPQVYIIHLILNTGGKVQMVFRNEEKAIQAVSRIRTHHSKLPVGYSRTSKESTFVLRKAGVI